MQASRTSVRRWILISLCVLIGAAAAGVIAMDVMRRAVSMQLADTSADAVLAARPGTRVQAVVRIGAPAEAGTFVAEVLQNTQGANYRETGASIRVAMSADTRLIMGAAPDLRTGAVVQADGAMDSARTLRAAKIVILNDYVRVTR